MKEAIIASTPCNTYGERSELGYERTVCACIECINNCRHIPGYLIPADVGRIAHHLGFTSLIEFAFKYLLASPGATVMQAGHIFQIPTLVPRRKADGSCVFLDENNRCRIHEVSPYGCAFFDSHQPNAEANERSSRGLQEIAKSWSISQDNNVYTALWQLLFAAGLRAIPAHIARAMMKEDSEGESADSQRHD